MSYFLQIHMPLKLIFYNFIILIYYIIIQNLEFSMNQIKIQQNISTPLTTKSEKHYKQQQYNIQSQKLNFFTESKVIRVITYQNEEQQNNQQQKNMRQFFNSNCVIEYPQEIIDRTNQCIQPQKYTLVIKLLQKILVRFAYRKFMKKIMFYVIKNMESKMDKLLKQSTIRENKAKLSSWMHQNLFIKSNPTEQEQTIKQFIIFCVIKIQSHFRKYMATKLLKKYKLRRQILNGLVKGWKVRKILKSNKLEYLKNYIRELKLEIQTEYRNNRKNIDNQLNYLTKQLKLNLQLFKQQFEYLYKSGGWVFERNIRNRNNSFRSIQPLNLNQQKNIHRQKQKRIREFYTERVKYNEQQHNPQKKPLDCFDRPIITKGKYDFQHSNQQLFNNTNETNRNVIKKMKQKLNQSNQHNNAKIEENQKKRKPKYDPKKAIQQEKNKKQKKQLKSEKNNVIHIDMNQIFNKKPQINIKTDKNVKNHSKIIQTYLDKITKKKQKSQTKQELHQGNEIIDNYTTFNTMQNNNQILMEKSQQKYSQLGTSSLKYFKKNDELKKKIMENKIKDIELQTEFTKNLCRNIEQLQHSYNSLYRIRYKKIFQKLHRLEKQRKIQNREIPLILNKCIFDNIVRDMDDYSYDVIYQNLQKKYRNIEQKIRYKNF